MTDNTRVANIEDAYHRDAEDVVSALGSDATRGLGEEDASARLASHGANEMATEQEVPGWRRFLAQFQDTLVLLLIGATAVSAALWLYEREDPLPFEALAIAAVVLLNAIVGYIQESRARAAVRALEELTAAEATVMRSGRRRRIPAREVVPGDLLLLEEGDAVAADGRLVHSVELQLAESALTGESVPVEKDTATVTDAPMPIADRHDMVFNGTVVTHGRGAAVVTATGMATEMGKVAGLLAATPQEDTPLQRELDRTGRVLGMVVMAIAVVMIATILLIERVDSFAAVASVLILGVALAVAAVPEGLPAVVTAVLSMGVRRMARRNAIVRHLAAVETLGSATVIASDKTGTLTRNEMTVRVVVTASGRAEFHGAGYSPEGEVRAEGGQAVEGAAREELEGALRVASLASNAVVREEDGRWIVDGDPTEGALVAAAAKVGLDRAELEERLPRVGEIPFSSERKLMSTVHRDGDGRMLLHAKGAPDVLLDRCTREMVGGEAVALDDARRAELSEINRRLAAEAMRTLAVAVRELPGTSGSIVGDGGEVDGALEQELAFAGLIGMMDPPRPEAMVAVERAMSAGIRPLMITGDHPETALAVAREIGIADGGRVVTGAELMRLGDDELREVVAEASVYARVDPEHKLRIVNALQDRGEVVAMTGDGVNDAPALRKADIGVAMGVAGTDVSRQAADMILADDNFATIVAAVEEGRGIFSNIRKFLRFLLSSNIGEVLTMFFGVLLGDWIGLPSGNGVVVLPLAATQILWINLVTDGAPALALGVDPADDRVMERHPRPRGERVITGWMWRDIALVGMAMAASALFVLDLSLPGGQLEGSGTMRYAQTMVLTTLVLAQLFNLFNARSERRSAFVGMFRNGWLWGAVALSLALHMLVIYLPVLRQAFGTAPLAPADWLVCLAAGSMVFWFREALKVVERAVARRHPGQGDVSGPPVPA